MFNSKSEADVVVIKINGCIYASEDKKNNGITPEKFQEALNEFDLDKAELIIIDINSGGGSPVGSSMIHDMILELRKDVEVIAHCRDICASGAYMIASACDRIYAHRSSLIGSIGVIMSGFGLDQFIEKHNIEYREFTAGENKGFLSPFKPVSSHRQEEIQELLNECHKEFIDMVYNARKVSKQSIKLMEDNKDEIVTAKVFSGANAYIVGLIDGFKNPQEIISEFTNKSNPKVLSAKMKEGFWKRLFSMNVNVNMDDLMTLENRLKF